MDTDLQIHDRSTFDFLSLSALMHQLDPNVIPFRKTSKYAIHISENEFNYTANLADCFGMKTAIANAMIDYPIGELIAERVHAINVTNLYKRFPHDNITEPN